MKLIKIHSMKLIAISLAIFSCNEIQDKFLPEKIDKFESEYKKDIEAITFLLYKDKRLDTNYSIEILPRYNNLIQVNYLDSSDKRGAFIQLSDFPLSKNLLELSKKLELKNIVYFSKEQKFYLTPFYFKKGDNVIRIGVDMLKVGENRFNHYNDSIIMIRDNFTYYLSDAW